MSRLVPRSLFGQTLAILLAGFVVSQVIGYLIYTQDRGQAVRAIGGFAAAQRIANLAQLVRDAPNDWRQRIVVGLSDPSFRVALSAEPPQVPSANGADIVAVAIRDFLAGQLSLGPSQQPLVSASPAAGHRFSGLGPMAGGPMMMRSFGGFGGFRSLDVAIPLPGGQWLTFATTLPETGPGLSSQFVASLAVMAIIILVASIWAVRRVTSPLASLAAAAQRLGGNLGAPPIPETGTIEVRQASHAFNTMQTRLRGLIENRTRMLAAISHDLRTPLTLLRLRTENVADVQERDKMLATICEMDRMVAATLQAARDEAMAEQRRRTDLTALLASVVDDMADAGLPVEMEPSPPFIYECQPSALKRALTNLLDNAVKYGKLARATVRSTPQAIQIVVEDSGPGIPEDEMAKVIQPFYRVEGSRSRETGGIGLGLAIALSVVEAHGGTLTLANRPEGGLQACITLPIQREEVRSS
jgi:signal transduction histidine kinase